MKVLVIDDHPVIRAGLAALLGQIGPDTIVLQAGDAGQAMAIAAEHADLEIVLLDLVIPGSSGFEVIPELGRIRPDLPILVLSSSEEPQDVRKAFAQGALGYVPKSAGQQTLLTAVRMVLNGDLYVPPLLLTELPANRSGRLFADSAAMTERQIEVLRLLGEGQSNGVIALALGLSEKTVKAHVTAIFRALNVVSRTQASATAREAGLI